MSLNKITLKSKLYAGFGIVLTILLVVSLIAWQEFENASMGFKVYRGLARDTNLAGRLQANMLMVRMSVKNFIITGSEKDQQEYASRLIKMTDFLKEAQEEIKDPERAAMIKKVAESMGDYQAGFKKVVQLQGQRNQQLNGVLNVKGPQMEKLLTEVMASAYQDKDPEASFYAGKALRLLLLARLDVVKFLDDHSKAVAGRVDKGFAELAKGIDELKARVENPHRKQLISEIESREKPYYDAFGKLTAAIWARNDIIGHTLDKIGPAVAKLCEDVKLSVKQDQDTLGPKLQAANERAVLIVGIMAAAALVLGVLMAWFITRSITRPINAVIAGLTEGAGEVANAADHVSKASQSLAQGAAEQAASLEETSSAMEEMSSMTRKNAENAGEADGLSREAKQAVERANAAMSELTTSIEDITKAGEETGRIIKTIDEIAFQTNLLALNAAVEAARAGEAGAGFAVVADEVRNLAMRAAEAAQNTTSLIEGTIVKTKHGRELVANTNQAFSEVYESTMKVGELVSEIAAASAEQAQGIDQVNISMGEMDKVTQQNAANAEESAAASEELSAQAETMQGFVGDLATLVGSGDRGQGRRIKHAEPQALQKQGSKYLPAPAGGRSQHNAGPVSAAAARELPLDDDEQDFADF